MSFYGNIKRVQSSPFVFDKYYPNRAAMDAAALNDNVYIGRYVLVKYTCKYESQDSNKLIYFDKYEAIPNSTTNEKQVCQDYQSNADIDINRYNDTFDGTVWQKIYTNVTDESGTRPIEKYIMVAELNAAVPRLELIEPNPAPKYFAEEDGRIVEKWRSIEINEQSSSEDAYSIRIPEILHLELGDQSNLFDTALLNPAVHTVVTPEGEGIDGNPPSMFDANNNYMSWKSYYQGHEIEAPQEGDNIDAKCLESKLNGLGQAISDIYDALYGRPAGGSGPRPFFTENITDVLSQYDKGLIGILSSIATESKGDLAKDLYGRTLQPGMYYYFSTKWTDAEEDPDNFIENIPKVIGSSEELNNNKAHFCIQNWALTSTVSSS